MTANYVETAHKLNDKARAAFWGAASGDALGWPNEMPNRFVRQEKHEDSTRTRAFETWRRKCGGRFMPYEETILAGEYSDDTQLILSTARSLLRGRDWLWHFAYAELPTWSLYSRGSGGATNRGVELWVKGHAPWSMQIDASKREMYFDAGGNGVAMRILPHALCGARDKSFEPTATAIFLNGICTHGHPRALLGALVYGYAAWEAFRMSGTLPYGHLLELTLEHVQAWSLLPESGGVLAEWRESAQQTLRGQLSQHWSQTIKEVQALLERSLKGIQSGALSIDSQVLADLGCFDRAKSGAGSVCAAASLYLASKYAPDPQNGIIEAAAAKGADTDTLASMAGALLGIISGIDWLQGFRNQLQDEKYIGDLADSLCSNRCEQHWDSDLNGREPRPEYVLDRFVEKLLISKKTDELRLPDGRDARIEDIEPVATKSRTQQGNLWKLRASDGQSIYIKRFQRSLPAGADQVSLTTATKPVSSRRSGRFSSKVKAIKLIVRDLERSRQFYSEVLALRVVRESKSLVNFGNILSIVPVNYASGTGLADENSFQTRAIVCLETSKIEVCHEMVSGLPDTEVTAISERAGRRMFRCVDPDQNVVEIFEVPPRNPASLPERS